MLCVVVTTACGGDTLTTVKSTGAGGTSAGGKGGSGASATGGFSSGGTATDGSSDAATDAGIVYDPLCPTVVFQVYNGTGSIIVAGYQPMSVPGCCLPSGECGGAFADVPQSEITAHIFPPDGCYTYALIESLWVVASVAPDPHQACAYPGRDAGADASTSTDASAPSDSGARDSTGDRGG